VRRHRSAPAEASATLKPLEAEQAWRTLSLVRDLITQAETKLGVVLAAAGVSGGVLFNLVKNRHHPSMAFDVAAAICAASTLMAGVCTMIGLYPRVTVRSKSTGDVANPLFFHDIAKFYKGDPFGYSIALLSVAGDPEKLARYLGNQVHANAVIAQRKYRWADWAIRLFLLDLLAITSLAVIAAFRV
jgi:Family of unknown function (DUF5706)